MGEAARAMNWALRQWSRIYLPLDYVAADLTMFELTCEARALLHSVGRLDLHEAVDSLQREADEGGLIEAVGQDMVQDAMSRAFHRAPSRAHKAPSNPIMEQIARRPRAPAASTIDAFWYVVRLNNPERLKRWLKEHPDEAPHLRKLLEERRNARA